MAAICSTAVASGGTEDFKAKDAAFVLKWSGKHKDSNRIGMCTATFIAPQWAITAEHCAVKLLNKDPNDVKVTLSFYEGKKIKFRKGVRKAFRAPTVGKQRPDIALVKLSVAVNSVEPAVLDARSYKTSKRRFEVVRVGTSGGFHWTPSAEVSGSGASKLTVDNTNGSGMKGGDSGGAWLRREKSGRYVLSGVIHGGVRKGKKRFGIAYQPSFVRDWIDETTGGAASWTDDAGPDAEDSSPDAEVEEKFAVSELELSGLGSGPWLRRSTGVGLLLGAAALVAASVRFSLREVGARHSSTRLGLLHLEGQDCSDQEANGAEGAARVAE